METNEVVSTARDFLYSFYEAELMECIRRGKSSISIDFSKIAEANIDLANYILEEPFNAIKCFEIAAIPDNNFKLNIRFFNISKSQRTPIKEIRKNHIGQLLSVEGVVRQKSDVKPKALSARFECPGCGNVIPLLQLDKKFREPSECSCGRKGKFRLLSKELEDSQWLMLEESVDSITGDRAKKVRIHLDGDLTSPLSERRTCPGNKIRVNGVLREIPIELKDGTKSTEFDLIIEANYVESIEESFEELNITQEDEKKILDISKKNPFNSMIEALLPNIFGYVNIKKGLLLQLFGGLKKEVKDDSTLRGDIHVLLCGDPGCGKSVMLKRMCSIWPKARYTVAATSTGTGFTGAVVKDELSKGWALEAGPLSLASKGLCAVDEIDKADEEDLNKLHEGME